MIPSSFNIDFFVLIVITLLGSVIIIKTGMKILNFFLNKLIRKSQKI